METLKWRLYERRLDACLVARDRCGEGTWGWTYWSKCFTILLNKMNAEVRNTYNS